MAASSTRAGKPAGVPAGYSGKALAQKLGLKPGLRLGIIAAPDAALPAIDAPDLTERLVLPDAKRLPKGPFDVLHAFFAERAALDAALPHLKDALQPAGMIWISWPKKASGVTTDLTEDVIRSIALDRGLVDVKVCAVDETWSGLKLVIPLRERR